jgi:hypothetical protein
VCGSSGNRKIHDYGSRTVITPGSKGKGEYIVHVVPISSKCLVDLAILTHLCGVTLPGKDMLGPDVTYQTVPLKVHPETIFAPVKSTNGVVQCYASP